MSGAGSARAAVPKDAARWLALAASPSFTLMALIGMGGPAEALCAASTWLPLDTMTTMYLMMALFHAGPWVRLLSRG